jgi:hypothetical protein
MLFLGCLMSKIDFRNTIGNSMWHNVWKEVSDSLSYEVKLKIWNNLFSLTNHDVVFLISDFLEEE